MDWAVFFMTMLVLSGVVALFLILVTAPEWFGWLEDRIGVDAAALLVIAIVVVGISATAGLVVQ